jgi:hypothetical protein
MRDLFREHHKLSPDELNVLWRDCEFALDTNVLLNIYRYADKTREDLFRVLRHLGPRVWVPYQVAKEFYANRIEVIGEQRGQYEQLSAGVSTALAKVTDGKFRKSGFLKVQELEAILKPAVEQAIAFIDEQRKSHPDLIHDDPFLETLAEVIGGSVGREPSTEETQRDSTEAQARIERKQPPGYRDEKKAAPERYGDVFIWFELLRRGEDRKRPIVFITDDDKEDWWLVVKGRGQKLGPRPELREEMRKRAGVEFYIYNPALLLERIGKEMAISVDESSIDDAKKIAAELHARSAEARLNEPTPRGVSSTELRTRIRGDQDFDFAIRAERAVRDWVIAARPEATIARGGRTGFACVEDGVRTLVEVRVLRHSGVLLAERLRESGYRAHFLRASGQADHVVVVVVAQNEEMVAEFSHRLDRRPLRKPHPEVVVGHMDAEGTFWASFRLAEDLTGGSDGLDV